MWKVGAAPATVGRLVHAGCRARDVRRKKGIVSCPKSWLGSGVQPRDRRIAGSCWPSRAAQAQITEAQKSAMRANCRSDFMANCMSIPPGSKEALECLRKPLRQAVARLPGRSQGDDAAPAGGASAAAACCAAARGRGAASPTAAHRRPQLLRRLPRRLRPAPRRRRPKPRRRNRARTAAPKAAHAPKPAAVRAARAAAMAPPPEPEFTAGQGWKKLSLVKRLAIMRACELRQGRRLSFGQAGRLTHRRVPGLAPKGAVALLPPGVGQGHPVRR